MSRLIGMKNSRSCTYWRATCTWTDNRIIFFCKTCCFHGSNINCSELCDVTLCIPCERYQRFEGFAKSVFRFVPWRCEKNNSSGRLESFYQPAWRCIQSGPSPRFVCCSSLFNDEILLWKVTVRCNIKVKQDKLYVLYRWTGISQSSWQLFNLEQRRKINKNPSVASKEKLARENNCPMQVHFIHDVQNNTQIKNVYCCG